MSMTDREGEPLSMDERDVEHGLVEAPDTTRNEDGPVELAEQQHLRVDVTRTLREYRVRDDDSAPRDRPRGLSLADAYLAFRSFLAAQQSD